MNLCSKFYVSPSNSYISLSNTCQPKMVQHEKSGDHPLGPWLPIQHVMSGHINSCVKIFQFELVRVVDSHRMILSSLSMLLMWLTMLSYYVDKTCNSGRLIYVVHSPVTPPLVWWKSWIVSLRVRPWKLDWWHLAMVCLTITLWVWESCAAAAAAIILQI